MKVLLVNDYGVQAGGAELQLLTLRDGLQARGHTVRYFASRAAFGLEDSFADYGCFGTTTRLQVLSAAINPDAYWQLRQALDSFRPDIVHVSMLMWQLSPLILPLLRDRPCVYHIVNYKAICPTGTKMLPSGERCQVRAGSACYQNGCVTVQSWVPLMLQQGLWQRWHGVFSTIVANGTVLKRRLVSEGVRVDAVIRGSVTTRPPRLPLSGPPVVGFVGRLVPEKGAAILLQAFAAVVKRLPEARLMIVGDGSQKTHLITLAATLGISGSVTLLGHCPRSQMEAHLSAAWVQAVPSLWEEPFGLVTLDAMMRGTAVVASAAGELAGTVVHGETGLLLTPGSVDELAEALVTVLSDRELAEGMGQAGRRLALERYNEDIFVESFLAIYDSIRQGQHG